MSIQSFSCYFLSFSSVNFPFNLSLGITIFFNQAHIERENVLIGTLLRLQARMQVKVSGHQGWFGQFSSMNNNEAQQENINAKSLKLQQQQGRVQLLFSIPSALINSLSWLPTDVVYEVQGYKYYFPACKGIHFCPSKQLGCFPRIHVIKNIYPCKSCFSNKIATDVRICAVSKLRARGSFLKVL